MLRISERLQTIAAMVPLGGAVADIGTDHGYVPAYLVLTGQCRYVIASDIAEGPCRAAAETRKKYNLQDKMDIRTAPGLQGLQAGEAETVVIAGMGGVTIIDILEESPEVAASVKTFVLQPMNAANLLRRWLTQHGYRIAEEALCKENDHIYIIIKAIYTDEKQELSSLEEELGPCILNSKPALWWEYVRGKAEQYHRLVQQMEASSAAMNSDKYKNLKKLIGQVDGLTDKSL
ncbi:MAG: SAM-dependent methyltransferase [Acidaminococcaceae bacterium]|nr:SAM-dependent methyltransferase [Acidaminococcaceae bacterium]